MADKQHRMTLTLQPESLNNYKLNFTRHFLVWCLFIIYETGSVFLATSQYGRLLDYLLFYSLNIGLFYLHSRYLLPSLFERKQVKWFLAILLIMVEMVIYLMIKFGMDYGLAELRRLPHFNNKYLGSYLIRNLWRGLFFIGAGSLYWSALRAARYQAQVNVAEKRELHLLFEQAKLEKNLAEIHNAYLQQQINPHFLFNALNFIYNSFYKLSEPAAKCVSKLADILRYSFQPAEFDGKCLVRAELEQIENLIELNRQRFRFPIYTSLIVDGDMDNLRILPLILLSFVENVFKHGNLKDEANPAIIKISTNGQQLFFECRNLKKGSIIITDRQNIGMANTLKRLEYTYQGNYELKIDDTEDYFKLKLRINL